MEYKDPEFELLSSPEQIILKMYRRRLPCNKNPIPLQNMSNCAKGQD